jgi:peptidoglycan hydrolase-like protein with peptidoglycan-binding domain
MSDTVIAIEAFQSRFTGAVDGVIAPGSQTWAALLATIAKVATDQENVSGVSQEFLPFPTVPAQS